MPLSFVSRFHRVLSVSVLVGGLCLLSDRQLRAQVDQPVLKNSVGIELRMIPAGKFWMGSPRTEGERDKKETRHEVRITKPFYLGVTEITQSQWARVMPPDRKNSAIFKGDDLPMENISWEAVSSFCETLSQLPQELAAGRTYRVPTEAEWEYACRAGTTTAFHYGDVLSSKQANFNGNYPYGDAEKGRYARKTTKVKSYKPNAFGLYDMHGNVAEWCADWFDPEYYENSPEEDPLGPPFGVLSDGFEKFYLVVRGGCWLDDARACRSAYRYRAMQRSPNRLVGLRVACDVKGESTE